MIERKRPEDAEDERDNEYKGYQTITGNYCVGCRQVQDCRGQLGKYENTYEAVVMNEIYAKNVGRNMAEARLQRIWDFDGKKIPKQGHCLKQYER